MNPQPTPTRCPSCGCTIASRYCPDCGERLRDAHDLSLAHFAEETLHGFTHFEGKALRTLRAVFVPGLLTAEYLRGARTRWVRPIALFLFVNLVYFVLQPLTFVNTFNTTLQLHLHRQVYSGWVRPIVEAHVASHGRTLDDFARDFDAHASSTSKLLLVVLAPALALFLSFVRRDGRSKPFGEHLVLALHYWCFQLLAISLAAMLLLRVLCHAQLAVGSDPPWLPDEFELGCTTFAVQVGWFTLALRRLDRRGRLETLLRGGGAALCAAALFVPYRLLMFWLAYWAT